MSLLRKISRHDAPGNPKPREPKVIRVPASTPYLGQATAAHISMSRPARLVARAEARRAALTSKR